MSKPQLESHNHSFYPWGKTLVGRITLPSLQVSLIRYNFDSCQFCTTSNPAMLSKASLISALYIGMPPE